MYSPRNELDKAAVVTGPQTTSNMFVKGVSSIRMSDHKTAFGTFANSNNTNLAFFRWKSNGDVQIRILKGYVWNYGCHPPIYDGLAEPYFHIVFRHCTNQGFYIAHMRKH
jgi:hypothetical protein